MRKHRAVPVRPAATAGLYLIIHRMRFEIIDFSRVCLPTLVVKVTPRNSYSSSRTWVGSEIVLPK